jgi:hypothetical protein
MWSNKIDGEKSSCMYQKLGVPFSDTSQMSKIAILHPENRSCEILDNFMFIANHFVVIL